MVYRGEYNNIEVLLFCCSTQLKHFNILLGYFQAVTLIFEDVALHPKRQVSPNKTCIYQLSIFLLFASYFYCFLIFTIKKSVFWL